MVNNAEGNCPQLVKKKHDLGEEWVGTATAPLEFFGETLVGSFI